MRALHTASTLTLHLDRSLASSGVATMRERFERLASSHDGDITLDFRDVEVIDGSGIGALAHLYRLQRTRGRRMTVRNVSGQPLCLLRELGINRILDAQTKAGAPTEWKAARRRLTRLQAVLWGGIGALLSACTSWPPPGQGGMAEFAAPLVVFSTDDIAADPALTGRLEKNRTRLACESQGLEALKMAAKTRGIRAGQILDIEDVATQAKREIGAGLLDDAETTLARLQERMIALGPDLLPPESHIPDCA